MNVPLRNRPGQAAAPAQRDSVLFAVLAATPGLYLEAAAPGAQPSPLARRFAQAGWQGIQLAVDGDHAGTRFDQLLAQAGAAQAGWMAVRGSAALRALERWQAGAERPPVLLVDAGQAGLPPPHFPWREALARAGYRFAASADGYHHFVRADHPALLSRLAEAASLALHVQLQEQQAALAQALRDAGQAHSAMLAAQSDGMAANARATMLQQHIDAILSSTSWKITKPLRWAMRLRHEPGPALRQLRAVARTLLRRVLGRLAAKVDASPALSRRAGALARRFPALARRIDSLAGPDAAVPGAPMQPPAIDPNNVVGPQFKTLLLDELGGNPPPSR